MTGNTATNIDDATIAQLGLRRSAHTINAAITPDARVFEFPGLDNVFIMESDLYGNPMPQGSCFLAFGGQHGLIGKPIQIDRLKTCSHDDIKNLVEVNCHG